VSGAPPVNHEQRLHRSRMHSFEPVENHPLFGQCRGPAVGSGPQRLFDESVHVSGVITVREHGSETCCRIVMMCVPVMRGLVMRDAVHGLDRSHRTGREQEDQGTQRTLSNADAHAGMVTCASRPGHSGREREDCQLDTMAVFHTPGTVSIPRRVRVREWQPGSARYLRSRDRRCARPARERTPWPGETGPPSSHFAPVGSAIC
jgi:hypothetical protein